MEKRGYFFFFFSLEVGIYRTFSFVIDKKIEPPFSPLLFFETWKSAFLFLSTFGEKRGGEKGLLPFLISLPISRDVSLFLSYGAGDEVGFPSPLCFLSGNLSPLSVIFFSPLMRVSLFSPSLTDREIRLPSFPLSCRNRRFGSFFFLRGFLFSGCSTPPLLPPLRDRILE